MKPKWKGAFIGAIVGLVLYLLFDKNCLGYALRENEIRTSALICGGVGGSSCCGISIGLLIVTIVIFVLIPSIFGIFIIKLIEWIKNEK